MSYAAWHGFRVADSRRSVSVVQPPANICVHVYIAAESCLLGPKVRQNKVVAVNHCNILTLLATDFHEVIDRFPSVRGIFQTVLFEMNSQEHAERRRRKMMRRCAFNLDQ
ncbi:hypothetical protein MRX96_052621 [Rhipicephalus microplus]